MMKYNPEWEKFTITSSKNQGYIDTNGYKLVRISCDYPMTYPRRKSKKTCFQYEHRLVMEKYLGRLLKTNEIVHHINGVRNDNRLENLQLLKSSAEHYTSGYYLTKCPKCDFHFGFAVSLTNFRKKEKD